MRAASRPGRSTNRQPLGWRSTGRSTSSPAARPMMSAPGPRAGVSGRCGSARAVARRRAGRARCARPRAPTCRATSRSRWRARRPRGHRHRAPDPRHGPTADEAGRTPAPACRPRRTTAAGSGSPATTRNGTTPDHTSVSSSGADGAARPRLEQPAPVGDRQRHREGGRTSLAVIARTSRCRPGISRSEMPVERRGAVGAGERGQLAVDRRRSGSWPRSRTSCARRRGRRRR